MRVNKHRYYQKFTVCRDFSVLLRPFRVVPLEEGALRLPFKVNPKKYAHWFLTNDPPMLTVDGGTFNGYQINISAGASLQNCTFTYCSINSV